MIKKRIILILLTFFCISGCAPVAILGVGAVAGVGGYKFYNGSLTVIYQAPYMKTWYAADKALKELDLVIKSNKHNEKSGKIKASRADGTSVTVSLKYLSSVETETEIRVGLMGDESASNLIKDKIYEALFG